MRPTRGAIVGCCVILLAVFAVWWWARPWSPRPFESVVWKADRQSLARYAMSEDLVRRIVEERWTEDRVSAETGSDAPRYVPIGNRSRIAGPYYIHCDFDENGRATAARIYGD